MERLVVDGGDAIIEVYHQLAGADRRFGVPLGPANDRLNARYQLAPVERLGQEIVRTEAKPLDLVIELAKA